jgi:hypothetical protein
LVLERVGVHREYPARTCSPGEQGGAVRFVRAIAFVTLVPAIAGCGDRLTLPNNPTPPPPPPPPRATGVSSAVLTMSNARVFEILLTDLSYEYSVKFLLNETTGTSGATVTNLTISTVNEIANTGPLCWRTQIRVPPGGTLDTFDVGWDKLAYCAPALLNRGKHPSVSVLVTYEDDQGRPGSVAATVPVTK